MAASDDCTRACCWCEREKNTPAAWHGLQQVGVDRAQEIQIMDSDSAHFEPLPAESEGGTTEETATPAADQPFLPF